MVVLTIYIMGLIVALHIFIISAMRDIKTTEKNGNYFYDKLDHYSFHVFLSFMWPIVIICFAIYGVIILASKWFTFVYSVVYKEENGTNNP